MKATNFNHQRVLVRLDFNVPLNNGNIVDDTRIKAALPTLNYLIEQKAKVICVSHLGRPKGKKVPELSLAPIAERLQNLLEKKVLFIDDCIGERVQKQVNSLEDGDICLLENVRFYEEETKNDVSFSKELASFADMFVQDAFGAVHRAHASTVGVTDYLESVPGFLVQKEVDYLSQAVKNTVSPYVAIVGGAKISSKIGVIEHLLEKVDSLIIGGGMAFTFLKAQGYSIGSSLCEDDQCELAASLLQKAKQLGKSLVLPMDVKVTQEFSNDAAAHIVSVDQIPAGYMGLDVGPDSLTIFKKILEDAKLIVWNGPLGVFEFENFSAGTLAIAQMLANSSAQTIVGGGDSIAALEKMKLSDKMTHISTGGGACLEFLEGKVLPGLSMMGGTYD